MHSEQYFKELLFLGMQHFVQLLELFYIIIIIINTVIYMNY